MYIRQYCSRIKKQYIENFSTISEKKIAKDKDRKIYQKKLKHLFLNVSKLLSQKNKIAMLDKFMTYLEDQIKNDILYAIILDKTDQEQNKDILETFEQYQALENFPEMPITAIPHPHSRESELD